MMIGGVVAVVLLMVFLFITGTEDDAVRAFMYLVRYREASLALSATPPSIASTFTPEITAARRVIAQVLSEERQWLDPVEIVALFDLNGTVLGFTEGDVGRRDEQGAGDQGSAAGAAAARAVIVVRRWPAVTRRRPTILRRQR